MTLQVVPLAERHIPEAIVLVRDAFENERAHIPCLPIEAAADSLRDAVTHAIRNGTAVAAEDSGHLTGFMSFYGPIDRLFGDASGAISPLHAHAANGADRERLYSVLFEHAANEIVAQGMTSIAVSTFTHDRDAAHALPLAGFGIRCADAIRDLQVPKEVRAVPGYTFASLAEDEIDELFSLENGLIRHLRSSPIFLPIDELTAEAFAERSRDARFYVARTGSGIVGYVKISPTGENLLTTVQGMLNITGAYLMPEHRGRGVFDGLVAYVAGTLRDKGVRLLGVDFETMNPVARRFWAHSFDTYAYTYARRIDDGILQYTSRESSPTEDTAP